MTEWVSKTSGLALIFLSLLPGFALAQQEKVMPAHSEQQICNRLLSVMENQVSSDVFIEESNRCTEKLSIFYHLVNETGYFSAEESYQKEAAYICDLYGFIWLPAEETSACQRQLYAIIQQNPSQRLLNEANLGDRIFSEKVDWYLDPLTQQLKLPISDDQKRQTQFWVSCHLLTQILLVNEMYGSENAGLTEDVIPFIQEQLSLNKGIFQQCQEKLEILAND